MYQIRTRLFVSAILFIVGLGSNAPVIAREAVPNAAAVATTGTLAGTVSDSAGKPLAGATVRIEGPATYSVTTDATGKFSVAVIPGVYELIFSRPGFSEFDSGSQPLLAGETRTVTVSLSDSTLTSLRTIGRITTKSIRPSINTASSGVSVLPSHVITERQTPDLAQIATELPGVTQQRGGQSPNSNFVIRGALQEANTAIDGHIIRSGNFGALLTTYIPAQAFGSIEVTKGPGQFGPTSGDSVFGTINFRTPDFAPGTFVDVSEGYETQFQTPYSNYFLNTNLLNDRLSLIAQYVTDGTGRPGANTNQFASISNSLPTPIVRFGSDFSSGIGQRSETLKARYRFSEATSLSATFFGVQGSVRPQGGAYARYLGSGQIYPCLTPAGTPGVLTADQSAATGLPVCDKYSAYNPPSLARLALDGPINQFAALNPTSLINDNEPQFEGEFRTTIGDGTLLVRPAFTLVSRTIDGASEANVAGQTSFRGNKAVAPGSFYLVTNPGNCAATFAAPNPTAGAGAFGPCFQGNNLTPFVTANNPCSAINPCFAAVTAVDAAGRTNFGTAFNQTQVDKDRDIQLIFSKPVGPHTLQFGYDYNSDDNFNLSGDPSALLLGRSANPIVTNPAAFQTIANTPISYPRSIQRRNDFQVSAQLQLGPNLQLAVSDYYTNARLGYSTVNPAVFNAVQTAIAAKDPRFDTATFGSDPNTYISASTGYLDKTLYVHHNDPQAGLTFRPNRDIAVRASAGSSTFVPYANQVSGGRSLNLTTSAASSYPSERIPNGDLKYETTVGFDVGADIRYPSGLFSFDVFDNTIHNKITSYNQLVSPANAPIPLPAAALALNPAFVSLNQNFNAPLQRTYGLELNLDGTRENGFGYRFTGTFERAYFDQLPATFYTGQRSTLINGAQLGNTAPFSQSYGELNYHALNGFELFGGLQYTGANNQTLGPAYTLGIVGLRLPIGGGGKVFLQTTVDNVFNYTTVALGGSINNGGIPQVTFGPDAKTGVPSYGTQLTNLQFVQPRTVRVQLSTHIGTGSGPTTIGGTAPPVTTTVPNQTPK